METPCEIISSRVEVCPPEPARNYTLYELKITYTYEIQGKEHRAERYDFLGGGTEFAKSLRAIVEQLPQGLKTVCYVDPQDPTQAVLVRAFPWGEVVEKGLFPGMFFFYGGVLLLPLYFAAKRRRKFGEATLALENVPVARGAEIKGVLRLPAVTGPISVQNLKISMRTMGGQRSSAAHLLPPADSMVALPGGIIPLNFWFPLDDGRKRKNRNDSPDERARIRISAKTELGTFVGFFTVQVIRGELTPAMAAEAEKMRAEEQAELERFHWPADSPIRIETASGGGRQFNFTATPMQQRWAMSLLMAMQLIIWGMMLRWTLPYEALNRISLVIGLVGILLFWMLGRIWWTSTWAQAGPGGIIVSNHSLFFNRKRFISVSDIKKIQYTSMNNENVRFSNYYHITIERSTGTPVVIHGYIKGRLAAHWLAREMARSCGVGE